MAATTQKTLLASAARTASVNSDDQKNAYHRGVRVHIKVTADPAAASLTYTIEGKDQITGTYYTLLASAAVASVSDTFLLVYPGATVTSNVSANSALPAWWRVKCTAADTDSFTYQVTAELLV